MPLHVKRNQGGGIAAQILDDNARIMTRGKRKSNEMAGGGSQAPNNKRAAFGDITNAFTSKNTIGPIKKAISKKASQKTVTVKTSKQIENERSSAPPSKSQDSETVQSSSEVDIVELKNQKNLDRKVSTGAIKEAVAAISLDESDKEEEEEDFVDIDAENEGDPHLAPNYAAHIFKYLKEKELLEENKIDDYFIRQNDITRHMRSVLVDWLVEVQENFELNHETLYLAVKLTDMYLMRCSISKDLLQLLGATALFISCKYDERIPPALDDFLYICDDAYTRQQFIDMEKKLLRTVDFNLGVPLSYRFLRRYAKCAHATLETLTLARFILELSLMDSSFVQIHDSIQAAGALLLAFKMKGCGTWDSTLCHYTGYKEEHLTKCVRLLNSMMTKAPNKQLMTVRNKYSHPLFHEVAKIPVLDMLEL